jgi:hypothetical protein
MTAETIAVAAIPTTGTEATAVDMDTARIAAAAEADLVEETLKEEKDIRLTACRYPSCCRCTVFTSC